MRDGETTERSREVDGVLFVVLLVNTAYIAAFASPTIFYMGNVLAHLVLGLVLAVAFGRAAGPAAGPAAGDRARRRSSS